ncbi:MAG: hypothetical protein ACRD1S_13195 [Vicinamibacterales bacterium]
MFKLTVRSTLGIVCLVAAGVVSGVSGQTQRPPASMDDLLAEVRALRAELNQASGASIRAQLLVGRLQLQEHRINTIVQQMTSTREQLAGVERTRALIEPQWKASEEEARNQGAAAAAGDTAGHPVKALFEEQLKREKELRAQESSLAALLAAEQARWVEFNDRLDELERELQKRLPR